jgi:hypothetical protein
MVAYGVGESDRFIKPEDINQPWFPRVVQQENQAWANMGVPIEAIPMEYRQALAATNPALAQRLGVTLPAPTVNLLEEQGSRMRRLAAKEPRRRRAPRPQENQLQSIFLADQPPL